MAREWETRREDLRAVSRWRITKGNGNLSQAHLRCLRKKNKKREREKNEPCKSAPATPSARCPRKAERGR